jgi:hypothetical protein
MSAPTPPAIPLNERGTARSGTGARVRRLLRLLKLLARDPRVPRPVRGLILIGLLPVPGPLDEAVLIGAVAVLLLVRPGLLQTLWRESAATGESANTFDTGARR